MAIFKRICLRDETLIDGDKSLVMKRGKEYTTSDVVDGEVRVFTQYWVWLPVDWFAGEQIAYGAEK